MKFMKRKILVLAALLVVVVLGLSGCAASPAASAKKENAAPAATEAVTAAPTAAPAAAGEEEKAEETGPIIEPQAIADYLFKYGVLPDNFITKKEAQALGWDSSYNYVRDVAPGMSIGGDRFGNYEGNLPEVPGRKYYECDCYYTGGKRNAYRIIYSNDGHVWYTEDHYQTFEEMYPSK